MSDTLKKIAQELATNTVQQPNAMQDAEARQGAFDQIKAEVDKLGMLVGDGPNWEELKNKSKYYLQNVETDLRIACYLARAWSTLEGFEGLQAGLILIDSLLRNKTCELVPTRTHGRKQVLDWWAKHSQIQWRSDIYASSNAEEREQFESSLKELCKLIKSDAKLAGQPELLDKFLAQINAEPAVTNTNAEPAVTNTNADPAVTNTNDTESEANANVDFTADAADPDANEISTDAQANPGIAPETLQPNAELEQFLNLILTPISDDKPIGGDEYLSDEFEYIKSQVNEMWRVADVDWIDVFDHCRVFLSSMSKDLRVMSYCIYALIERDEISGLHRGLTGLQTFLQTFGAECHPVRPAGRRAALEWLSKASSRGYCKGEIQTLDWLNSKPAVRCVRPSTIHLNPTKRSVFGKHR